MVDHHYQKDGYYNTVFTGNRDPTQLQANFCETDSLLFRSFNDTITFTIKGESSRSRRPEMASLRMFAASPAVSRKNDI